MAGELGPGDHGILQNLFEGYHMYNGSVAYIERLISPGDRFRDIEHNGLIIQVAYAGFLVQPVYRFTHQDLNGGVWYLTIKPHQIRPLDDDSDELDTQDTDQPITEDNPYEIA